MLDREPDLLQGQTTILSQNIGERRNASFLVGAAYTALALVAAGLVIEFAKQKKEKRQGKKDK